MTNTHRSFVERLGMFCLFLLGALTVHVILTRWGWLDTATSGLLLANVFATPTNVMRKVAARLVNKCVFAGQVNRSYDDEYKQRGAKQGDTVYARLPQRYEVTTGAIAKPTPLQDTTVPIKITDQSNICFEYDSWSATLLVDDYMERYGAPAVDQLIDNIDSTGLARCYKKVAKFVGTPRVVPGSTGTLPQAATQPYLDAQTELFEVGVPEPYIAMLTANMHAYLVGGTQGLFNPVGAIAANFRKGQFGDDLLGIQKWFRTQNIATHTVGALGGTPLVNLAGQTGATINADGAGAVAIAHYFHEGDCITFASVYEINVMGHQSVGRLKQFVVTADTDSVVTSGVITIPISPSIITSGPYATCSDSPANNDVILCFGHASTYAGYQTPQALVYNKDAFALVMADAILPRGLWVAERISNAKLGISIRMLKDHDIINDVSPARFDTIHGWETIRQELAVRICS